MRRLTAISALAVILAGGPFLPHLKTEEALGDGRGRLVYIDPVGVRTWCFGDTGPVPNIPLNEAVCNAQLDRKVREICVPVAQAIKVPVYTHEMAAICSWAYNVGAPKAISSTALAVLNAGNYTAVPDQLLRWKFAQGLDCTIRANNCYGVWNRRQKEARIFVEGFQ